METNMMTVTLTTKTKTVQSWSSFATSTSSSPLPLPVKPNKWSSAIAIAFLVSLCGFVSGDDTMSRPFCNICRDSALFDPTINSPLATFVQLNGTPVTCQEAQNEAFQFGTLMGFTTDQCATAQALAATDNRCGCPGVATTSPVPAPAGGGSTDAPTSMEEEKVFCVLCLSGRDATINGFIANVQCLEIEAAGLNSELTQSECVGAQLLADAISNPCGCRDDAVVTPNPVSVAPTPTAVFPTPTPPTTAPINPVPVPTFFPPVAPPVTATPAPSTSPSASESPSAAPSAAPSSSPSVSASPSGSPTAAPSSSPSSLPSAAPSSMPSTSQSPSAAPSSVATFQCNTNYNETNLLVTLPADINCTDNGVVQFLGQDQVLDCGGNTITHAGPDDALVLAGGTTIMNCIIIAGPSIGIRPSNGIRIIESLAVSGSSGVYFFDNVMISGAGDDGLDIAELLNPVSQVTITNSDFSNNRFGFNLASLFIPSGVSLDLVFANVTLNSNSDFNVIIDVENADVNLTMTDVEASSSPLGKGISIAKFSGAGSVQATLDRVTANSNDDQGLETSGDGMITIINSEFCGNSPDLQNDFSVATTTSVTCDSIAGDNTVGLSCTSC